MARGAGLVDLTARLARWLAEQRFDEAAGLFTPGVRVSTPGGNAEGIDAVVAQARGNHEGGITHHTIANVLPVIDGDRATITANSLLAFIHPDEERESLGGRYTIEAVRTDDGWRIGFLRVDSVWGGPGVRRAA